MKVTVLYFASLREATGISKEAVDLPANVVRAADLVAFLSERGAQWQQALQVNKGLRCAVNQEVVPIGTLLADGDEIALFPPVTGG
jgi:sulfur-carrier protein